MLKNTQKMPKILKMPKNAKKLKMPQNAKNAKKCEEC